MAILSVVLAQIASAAVSYDTCETQWAVLHFDPATAKITRNNLGGRGPDPCLRGQYPLPDGACPAAHTPPTGIIVEHVGRLPGGIPIDLHIRNTSSYTPNSKFLSASTRGDLVNNLVGNHFVSINVAGGTATDLAIDLVDHRTQQPVALPSFVMSFLDIDAGKGGAGRETLSASGFDEYLDVETSIVDDDETRETAPLSPAASSEAVVSPKGWLSTWLWGKD